MSEICIRVCKDCRTKFESQKPNAMLCPKCREEHRKKSWNKHNSKYKKTIADNTASIATVDVSLKEMVRIINYYNAKHHTRLSYGQFVLQVYLGKISLKKVIYNARNYIQKE